MFAYDPRPIIAALRRHRPHLIDLNHEPYSVACAEVLMIRDLLAPHVPVVMQTAQNVLRHYPTPFRFLQQRALRRVAAAYACSEGARGVLRAKGFEKPICLIPFGVDTEAFHPRSPFAPKRDTLTIGFLGRMLPGKGLAVLARALTRLRTANWKLLVVGDGSERERFESSLAEHDLLGRVEITGAVPYDQIPGLYRRMDIVVMPTHTTDRVREQFGRVLVEAMSSGVPVVGTTCGAIPEVIAEAGLVVPEGSPEALAEGLRRLLSDGALRNHLARAGRQRTEAHYSWDLIADRTYELYQQVLHAQTARSAAWQLEAAA